MRNFLLSIQNADELQALAEALKAEPAVQGKRSLLSHLPHVIQAWEQAGPHLPSCLSQQEKFCLDAFFSIGQYPLLQAMLEHSPARLQPWLAYLQDLEDFYAEIGGIVGYQAQVLQLLASEKQVCSASFMRPVGPDLSQDGPFTRHCIKEGLKRLPFLAEIYPVGGAGDRLGLIDEKTQKPLPTACLQLQGRTLLEYLFRDLQAREYLYSKLFQRQITLPVVFMTSHEKSNHEHVQRLLRENAYFHRPASSFRFCIQHAVPLVSKEGSWLLDEDYQIHCKPGGHGVIWQMLQKAGVLSDFLSRGTKWALVRQINNPIAGLDYHLLAFYGWGAENKKKLGFSSCLRMVHAAEGVLVLEKTGQGRESGWRHRNIEYVDFKKYHIEDKPLSTQTPYSYYPSNTNILFVDLASIEPALKKCPFPGLLLNQKNELKARDVSNSMAWRQAGRLESTMQNISDVLTDPFSASTQQLSTFVSFSHRLKTISVTKRSYEEGEKFQETPQCCFSDSYVNARELLQQHCGFTLPPLQTCPDTKKAEPSFFFRYHPALGPLYSIICQKLRGGKLAQGSEWELEVAEADVENLTLEGSLRIIAQNPLGPIVDSHLKYGTRSGKCTLKNVQVRNLGIDRKRKDLWKGIRHRRESLRIFLQGDAEFYAENVVFDGNHQISVPSGRRLVATMRGGHVHFILYSIKAPTWYWSYTMDDEGNIYCGKVS